MATQSPRALRPQLVVSVALALLYVAWAALFIRRSSVETGAGRYYCLFDDAMVSLRYAWNLAHGEGLVWNPGERVEGVTCFLFTLCMSLGALFFDKSTSALAVQLTGILIVLAVAVLACRMSRSLGAPGLLERVTFAAVLVYYPLSYWSLMGMETGFLAVISAGALLLAMQLGSEARGSPLLGVLLGAMFATRPDATLPALVILAFRAAWIWRGRRGLAALGPWLRELGPFVAIAAGLTLFRLAYYGSLLPNTYELKLGGWPLGPRLENGWKFVGPFLESSRYLLLLALGSVLIQRDARRLLLLCFAGSVIAAQVWVGGDAWRYWRLLVPGVVALIVLAVDAGAALARWLVPPRWHAHAQLGSALACASGALWTANQPFLDELRMRVPPYMVHLNRRNVKAGLELSQYADAQASVAVMAAGAAPYYSGLRGVDVLGKSDRHVARLPPRGVGGTITPGHNKYDLRYSIEQLRPDVIYDALARARYEPGVLGVVERNYVQTGSFWFRRDSPHVRWDRLPER